MAMNFYPHLVDEFNPSTTTTSVTATTQPSSNMSLRTDHPNISADLVWEIVCMLNLHIKLADSSSTNRIMFLQLPTIPTLSNARPAVVSSCPATLSTSGTSTAAAMRASSTSGFAYSSVPLLESCGRSYELTQTGEPGSRYR